LTPDQLATSLLQELGINRPEALDLEFVANSLGVSVKYRPLTSCEAKIVGTMEKAIVSIREDRPRPRQRFSIGHELGHWVFHRGQNFSCQQGDIEGLSDENRAAERVADQFSAELLMPHYLFDDLAKSCDQPTLKHIWATADIFQTSEMSTAIRMTQLGHYPMMVIYYTPEGRRWFNRSSILPSDYVPPRQMDPESHAYRLMHSEDEDHVLPEQIDSSIWLRSKQSAGIQLHEEAIRIMDGVMVILTFNPRAKAFN
jgi:Zn-dependent peptidase ImmA (M78 family)